MSPQHFKMLRLQSYSPRLKLIENTAFYGDAYIATSKHKTVGCTWKPDAFMKARGVPKPEQKKMWLVSTSGGEIWVLVEFSTSFYKYWA